MSRRGDRGERQGDTHVRGPRGKYVLLFTFDFLKVFFRARSAEDMDTHSVLTLLGVLNFY